MFFCLNTINQIILNVIFLKKIFLKTKEYIFNKKWIHTRYRIESKWRRCCCHDDCQDIKRVVIRPGYCKHQTVGGRAIRKSNCGIQIGKGWWITWNNATCDFFKKNYREETQGENVWQWLQMSDSGWQWLTVSISGWQLVSVSDSE